MCRVTFREQRRGYLANPDDMDVFAAEATKVEQDLFADIMVGEQQQQQGGSSPSSSSTIIKHRALVSELTGLVCRAYSELKLPDKTIKWCDAHLEHMPDSFEGLLARGDAYLVKERVEDALRDLNKAAELHGNDQRLNERLHRAQRLQKLANKRDYYKILGISRDASDREVKRAYRKLAKEWHPDTYRGNLGKEEVLSKMSEINLAYEVLSDEEKRRQYDEAGVDPNDPTGGGGGGGGQPFYGSPFFQDGTTFHFGGGAFEGFGGGKPFEFRF